MSSNDSNYWCPAPTDFSIRTNLRLDSVNAPPPIYNLSNTPSRDFVEKRRHKNDKAIEKKCSFVIVCEVKRKRKIKNVRRYIGAYSCISKHFRTKYNLIQYLYYA